MASARHVDVEYSAAISMNTQGSSSATQAVSSPLASAGVLGTTTLSPGVCTSHDSSICECCDPIWRPPVAMPRTVMGTGVRPPDM